MPLKKEEMIRLYTYLVRVRKMDEYAINALAEGKIQIFWHSAQGEEAVGVGVASCLREDDYLWYLHRSHGLPSLLPKGISPKRFFAEHFGKATGTCGGMAGYHTVAPELGIPGFAGIIGSMFSVSTGFAVGAKKRGKGQVVACFFGDGESNRGQLHESMNLAALWKLPIIWVCENNQYSIFVPVKEHYAREDIADLAAGYGMPGVVVDGQDVFAVYEAAQAAVARARAGEGPSLLECKTYRYRAHSEGTPDPRPPEEIEAWKQRDPIKLCRQKLLEQGVLTQKDVERIDREAAAEIEEADRFASESPLPDPSIFPKLLYAD